MSQPMLSRPSNRSARRDPALALLALLVLSWAGMAVIWGLPVLTLGALALVPVAVTLLVRIAWG